MPKEKEQHHFHTSNGYVFLMVGIGSLNYLNKNL